MPLTAMAEDREFTLRWLRPMSPRAFRLTCQILSRLYAKDLVPALGQVNRVYEILNGKRQLTLAMIWNLHRLFGILTDCLVQPPRKLAAA